MKQPAAPARGFTLIELMVTIIVLAILAAIGVPSFNEFVINNRLNRYANTLMSSLTLARGEAIKRNSRVVACASADGASCGGTWGQGWIVFVDLNNDAAVGGGETIVFTEPGTATGYGMTGGPNYVSYTSQGLTQQTNGAFQSGTFTICPPAPAPSGNGRTVVFSQTGRPRIAKITTCS